MATPEPADWTAIYVEQRNRAAAQFGAFEESGPNGKKVPHIPAGYARDVGGYWLVKGDEARKGRVAKLPDERRASFERALASFAASMAPYGATALVEGPAKLLGKSDDLMLSFKASVDFWAAVRGIAIALASAGVVPTVGDMWWPLVKEQTIFAARKAWSGTKEVAKALANAPGKLLDAASSGGKWVVVGIVAYAALQLFGRSRRA